MGYVIETQEEAAKIIRKVALYAVVGLVFAETEGQKQFALERICLEMGMGLSWLRERWDAKPGEPFSLEDFEQAFDRFENKG